MQLFGKKTPEPKLIEWRDGALRVREPLAQARKPKVKWGWLAVRAVAWSGLIIGMALFMWFFMYGVVALLS